ncbi:MAG TPA: DUF885 domain-containing protein [Nevskiaceae bacterium]|nr:DUF885 domain-containing protein [Nevskiaceae bacterium]
MTKPIADRPSLALDALCTRYWDFVCFEQPFVAIMAGRQTAGDALFRESMADHERRAASSRAFLAELEEIPLDALQGQDRQTHRLLEHDLALAVRAFETKDHLRPVIYPFGPEAIVNYLGDATTFACASDAETYLRRLRTIPAGIADMIACIEAGQREGFHYPRIVIERTTATLRALLARPLEQSSPMRPFVQSPVRSDEMQALRKAAETVVLESVLPALAGYADFVEKQLGQAARDSLACTDVPSGHAHYEMLIERFTTERGTAEEIHAFGLREVARISDRMQQVAADAGFPGDLAGYRAALPTKPGQVLSSAEALRERIEILSKRIDARLPEFFGRLPRMTYGIRSIPEALSPHMPPAYAQPNPANGTACGIHWVTSLPERCPSYMHVPLAMHEAWPGHLMHMALMQEMELPAFRRNNATRYSAQLEGWALYCEWLGHDFGLYDTPDKTYGGLEMEIWRACRLVVDTGLHAKGWSRDQAIDFMVRHMSMPIETIRAEVDRYIGMPAQALGYLLGFRCVQSVRAEAERCLGSAFRVRDFHDALMGLGAVTLPVMREAMQEWMQARASEIPQAA